MTDLWFAIRTAPQKEFVAERILRKQGLQTFLPVRRVWRRKNKFSRDKVERVFPLMVRYLFVSAGRRHPLWLDVFRPTCVQGVVGIGGKPWAVPGGHIERFGHLAHRGAFTAPGAHRYMPTHREFAVGDRVEIARGPLSGHVVEVTGINEDTRTGRVLMRLLGGERNLGVPLDNLEAAE